ncbi:hypothetical protein F443_22919 [Phytophthora nicotianae P1569]|uniref:Uncharacterized protein n=1 Tax=Phytophthora nicotianae P1569 TaxID=1317065 RepID=V9DTK8_PHYNI|nr:hypothetical protein F443_22919 [Phytophthora nicotianae P1569]
MAGRYWRNGRRARCKWTAARLRGDEGDTMDPERHALWREVSPGRWSDPCAGGGTERLS